MTARTDKLPDITRWNRAGLSRFDYVDGDAAVWLEELRIAAMGLVARGAALDQRTSQAWRDLFMCDKDQWPDAAEEAAFREALVWKTLYRTFPDRPETGGKRNLRLLSQYADAPGEYGWEIMRAFARAAHVLLGHLDAYANEGYLRTATQWENVRRLAAMVNHQPAPPTSAITTVGLILENPGETVEIERGLAMKYTPPEGGAPVVFETLSLLEAHPDLNDARAKDWDFNTDTLILSANTTWIAPEEAVLAPGALVALANASGTGAMAAAALAHVEHNTETERAILGFNPTPANRVTGATVLHTEPKDVRRAAPRTTTSTLVVAIETSANYPIGSIVRLHYKDGTATPSKELEVLGNEDGYLKLKRVTGMNITASEVTVETLAPFGGSGLTIFTSPDILQMFFLKTDGAILKADGAPVPAQDENKVDIPNTKIAMKYEPANVIGAGYAPTPGAKRESGVIVDEPPEVVPNSGHLRLRTIRFDGKPPKGIAIGDVMVMCQLDGTDLTAARVDGLLKGSETYHIQFHADLTTDPPETFQPDLYEFHGPMTRTLRPELWNRNPEPAMAGAVVFLEGLSAAAKELMRPGRVCLIEDERGPAAEGGNDPAQATILETNEETGGFKVSFESALGLSGFKKGWTFFRLNAVAAGHGETKSPKVIGSGDGERARQRFDFPAKRISFIPSSVAETGVAPDMDVLVDGVRWTYRDFVDPTADGAEAWSSTLNEDDSLTLHFRRRLPTGTNNLTVGRYRTGVGASGAVPARSFDKPMKKNRHVKEITQPFAATGGAEREPIADIRVNAPARLAANDRAVSVADFERLCRRRSDVWQASARLLSDPSIPEDVGIVLVLANGTLLADNPTLATDLLEFVESRAIPGTRVRLEDFDLVPCEIAATVQVDTERYDKNEVQEAAHAALVEALALKNRALGQTLYIAEVIAALERVEGVETATIQTFALRDADTILRTAVMGGTVTALVPFFNQVIAVETGQTSADITVAVEAAE